MRFRTAFLLGVVVALLCEYCGASLRSVLEEHACLAQLDENDWAKIEEYLAKRNAFATWLRERGADSA